MPISYVNSIPGHGHFTDIKAIALVVGLTFLQLDNSLRSLQYRVFAIFFTSILPALILAQIEVRHLCYVRYVNSADML